MDDIERRIRQELLGGASHRPDPTVQELSLQFHTIVLEEIHKLNKSTSNLLIDHLTKVQKLNDSLEKEVQSLQEIVQHLLCTMFLEPDTAEHTAALEHLRQTGVSFLEKRQAN